MSRWMITILFLVGSAILTNWIPFSSFFRNVDTMVHELGHAVTTLVLSGQVLYIELYSNHSGVTYSYIERGWRTIPLGLSGYITASLFAAFLFSLYGKGKLKAGFIAMTLLAVVSLAFFVNNSFGVMWLIGFMIVNVIAMLVPFEWFRKFYYLLVSFICLEESVMGPIHLILLSVTRPGQAGDASSLSRATHIPAIVWAVLFLVIALLCARKAIAAFVGRNRSGRTRSSRWESQA
ncbi:M50 family metallopeptidase [Paenibacillus hemerocallicola]|uniref:M50 family metallopeptidase n=1 Tax=Paenibacillus hemerocallicola TaxID=1172614 RepID=A0A5C4SXV3_9BACL|nr:M50 family metallopeptidase [Paenibacillus hemerocallicola]TNJ61065.1 M50 family metallopeptidase [Paenibacillus hemerocallicola]